GAALGIGSGVENSNALKGQNRSWSRILFRPFRAGRILVRIGSPGPTPQAGFPPPGLSCFGPFGAAEKRNTKTSQGGKGIARARRHSIPRHKNSRLVIVPPAQSTAAFHWPGLIQLAGRWSVGQVRGNLLRPRSIEASNLERPERSRLDIDHANLVIVRVGHIEAVSSHAQTARLIEAGRIVLAAGLAVARERLDCEGTGVANLDLVVVGIGDEKLAGAVGQAEAVLEADVRTGAVNVAELEEALTDDPADLRMNGIDSGDHADPRDFGVGDKEVPAVCRQAAGLGELGSVQIAILDVLRTRPRPDADLAGLEVQLPDLVRTGHGNVERRWAGNLDDVPRAAQSARPGRPDVAVQRAPRRLGAGPGNGAHHSGLQIDGPDRVVLGVGDVQGLTGQAHSLLAVETGLLITTIDESLSARADRDRRFAIQVGHDDPVVSGVGDEQPFPDRVGQNLARIEERTLGGTVVLGRKLERLEIELVLELRGDLADHAIEVLERDFTASRASELAVGSDQHQGRPARHLKSLPDHHISIIHHRVPDAVLGDLAADVLAIPLGIELPRVDADDHQLVLVFRLEPRQGGQ